MSRPLPELPWADYYLPPLTPAWAAMGVFAVVVALAVGATTVGARLTASSGARESGDAADRWYGIAAALYVVALAVLAAALVL